MSSTSLQHLVPAELGLQCKLCIYVHCLIQRNVKGGYQRMAAPHVCRETTSRRVREVPAH
jgi:hypothetical protein